MPHRCIKWCTKALDLMSNGKCIPGPAKSTWYPSCFTDGLNLPVEEWQKTINESIQRVQQLESDYEGDLITKRVSHSFNDLIACLEDGLPNPATHYSCLPGLHEKRTICTILIQDKMKNAKNGILTSKKSGLSPLIIIWPDLKIFRFGMLRRMTHKRQS